MTDLEKMEQAAKTFESKAAQIETLENEVKSVKESAKEITEIKTILLNKDEADKKNQEAIDQLVAWQKESRTSKQQGRKSFDVAFAEAVEKHYDNIQAVRKGHPFTVEIKSVGDMTTAASLTGDGQLSYSSRQALLPFQKLNFRDLIPSVVSPTGTYVHYKESAGEGSISAQTEGSAKTQIDFDLTEVQTVNEYISGYTRFSKQLMKQLPWLQQTLPSQLLREFYKAENSKFWSDITGASGIATAVGVETDDIKILIDAIGNQLNDNYDASFILVNPLQMARLQKLLYANGWNLPGGGVVSQSSGAIAIAGVPIIPASFATDDKGLVIDRSYVERVEVESVRVEFFEQDATNVTTNKITARIECYEKVNLMLPASARYFDFGNAS